MLYVMFSILPNTNTTITMTVLYIKYCALYRYQYIHDLTLIMVQGLEIWKFNYTVKYGY